MQRPPRSRRFLISVVLLGALMLLFAILLAAHLNAEYRIRAAEDQRLASFLLADELRQSSDDLTRMARTYVATGEQRYRDYFDEILAIRDGSAPRPQEYHTIYWDLVGSDGVRPRPAGEPVSLLELMEQTGFTDEELAVLSDSKQESDALAAIEVEAMNLVAADPANRGTALALLNGEDYHAAKAAIMQPIDQFYGMVDDRTAAAISSHETSADVLIWIVAVVGVAIVVVIVYNAGTLRAVLGASPEELRDAVHQLGEDPAEVEIPAAPRDSAMSWVATAKESLLRAEERRAAAEEEVRHLALHDHLTGLPNRRLFGDRIEQAMKASQRNRSYGALLFLDLDEFKELNDVHGHAYGDELLKAISGELVGCLRGSDTVARIGGDEFLLLLTGLGEDLRDAERSAEEVAAKCLDRLGSLHLDGAPAGVRASIGVALFMGRATSPDRLVAAADQAMYWAKAEGRGTVRSAYEADFPGAGIRSAAQDDVG